MRPIAINQRALRTTREEVDAVRSLVQRPADVLERLEQEALDSLERLALADRTDRLG